MGLVTFRFVLWCCWLYLYYFGCCPDDLLLFVALFSEHGNLVLQFVLLLFVCNICNVFQFSVLLSFFFFLLFILLFTIWFFKIFVYVIYEFFMQINITNLFLLALFEKKKYIYRKYCQRFCCSFLACQKLVAREYPVSFYISNVFYSFCLQILLL